MALIWVLLPLVFSSCSSTFAYSSKKNGIPKSFSEVKNHILLCETSYDEDYNEALVSVFTSRYKGEVEFIEAASYGSSKYSNIEKYRFVVLREVKRETKIRSTRVGNSNLRNTSTYVLNMNYCIILDRKTGLTYGHKVSASKPMTILKLLSTKLERARLKS